MSISEIVDKIVGPTMPVGSTHLDDERYNNLELLEAIAMYTISQLISISANRNREEYSMQKAGKRAYEILNEISEIIKDV
jgi:hypothetical protein